jgi:hypothetical protein
MSSHWTKVSAAMVCLRYPGVSEQGRISRQGLKAVMLIVDKELARSAECVRSIYANPDWVQCMQASYRRTDRQALWAYGTVTRS